MSVLDKRYQTKHYGKDAPLRTRVEGEFSKSIPPPNAPRWAIDKTWKETFLDKCKYKNVMFHNYI